MLLLAMIARMCSPCSGAGVYDLEKTSPSDETDINLWFKNISFTCSDTDTDILQENQYDGCFGHYDTDDYQQMIDDEFLIGVALDNLGENRIIDWRHGVYKSISTLSKKRLERKYGNLMLYFYNVICPKYCDVRHDLGYK